MIRRNRKGKFYIQNSENRIQETEEKSQMTEGCRLLFSLRSLGNTLAWHPGDDRNQLLVQSSGREKLKSFNDIVVEGNSERIMVSDVTNGTPRSRARATNSES